MYNSLKFFLNAVLKLLSVLHSSIAYKCIFLKVHFHVDSFSSPLGYPAGSPVPAMCAVAFP